MKKIVLFPHEYSVPTKPIIAYIAVALLLFNSFRAELGR